MPLCDEEFVGLKIREMDSLLLAEDYAKARAVGDELIARYPDEARAFKAAGYAALLDEKSDDGFIRQVELLDRARDLRPDDLQAWFSSAWAGMTSGWLASEERHESLMADLAWHDAQSRYVAYACAHHPERYKDRQLGERLVERGMGILPNLMALWYLRILLAGSVEEMEELFRQAKAIEPFHDYCEMRSMEEYVAQIISQDATFNRSKSLDHLLWSGGLGEPPPSPLPSLDDLLLSRSRRRRPSPPHDPEPKGDDHPQ